MASIPADVDENRSAQAAHLATGDVGFEEFSSLTGEWLLLEGNQLLAHSRDYREINAEIKKSHLKDCLVHYVPASAEREFILI